MKRSAVAAAALVGASALTGSVVAPGSATTAAPQMHTKRMVLHQTESHNVGRTSFIGADVDRSRAGKIVGYDAITGKFYPTSGKVVIDVAFALKGGIIMARVSSHGPGDNGVVRYQGPILKGSGKYKGIDGTITAHSPSENEAKTFVKLRYHL